MDNNLRLADSVLPPAIDTERFAILERLLDRLTHDDIGSVLVMLTDVVTPTALDFLADHFSLLDEGWQFAQDDNHRRALIKSAIEIHRHKGTPWAIKKLIAIYGLDVKLVEWFDDHTLPRQLRAKDVDLLTDVSKVGQVMNVLPILVEASPVSNTLNVVCVQEGELPSYIGIKGLGQVNIRGITTALAEGLGDLTLLMSAYITSVASVPKPYTMGSIKMHALACCMTANYVLERKQRPLFRILS